MFLRCHFCIAGTRSITSNDDMTRLYYVDANLIAGTDDLGVILLADADTQRGISIVCEKLMVDQLQQRQSGKVDTARHLPEVLWTIIRRSEESKYRILFSNMQEERYIVFLYDETRSAAHAMRASDAVLLAVIANIPIFIDDNLFMRQSIALQRDNQGIRIPINSLTTPMLEDALQRAIEEEQFEHASHIRDEWRRRREQNGVQSDEQQTDTNPPQEPASL